MICCGATSEYQLKSAFLKERERDQFGPKFQVQLRVVPHQPFFVFENQDKRSFVLYKNVGTNLFRFVTITTRLTDRQTGRRTERLSQYRALHNYICSRQIKRKENLLELKQRVLRLCPSFSALTSLVWSYDL